ncbi:DUF2267 domain-containing protein [Nocardia sp. NPDC006630]|uniref:DUF2267 domain-containing protein n=1 Tax=Nocardia sp. NPDC006630 TaxID=3157181 RepID=UPI00339FFED8
MSQHTDPFAPAVHTAHTWLAVIAGRLETEDRMFAHRAVRAWLHTLRDRLGVHAAAHLSAQLPELFRGTFYEGWMPGHVPVPHDVPSFLTQFAREAGVSIAAASVQCALVTDAFAELFSPGQLDHVLAQIPAHLRSVLLGAEFGETVWDIQAPSEAVVAAADIAQRIQVLSDAVAALARGLAVQPNGEPSDTARVSEAQQARL